MRTAAFLALLLAATAQGQATRPDLATLPDFSFVGYHRGEAPIPTVPVVARVTDFGATPNDDIDDTEAFKQAIAKTKNGALEIPAGRYIISDILEITKPNLVLRGTGPDQTTLYFPKFLNDVRPNWGATTGGERTSNYSWGGGFLWVRGNYGSKPLADISPAKRGESVLTLSTVAGLSVGQSVDVTVQDEAGNSLAIHLYADDPGNISKLLGKTNASLVAKIIAIKGNTITLDRPLRFDLDSRWKPTLLSFAPTVTEVGIENLRFEFPNIPYPGHFKELGHNPIALERVADCWVRNVAFHNVDSGPMVASRFSTLENLTWTSDRAPSPKKSEADCNGHHGLYFYDDDNLLTTFRFNQRFIHDLTVSHAAGNVIMNGSGKDLCFDHHKRASYANLWTNIDLGAGTRPYRSGGGADLGKHSAAQETFWNLKAAKPLPTPPPHFAPLAAIHFHPDAPNEIPNLYEYQLKQRLNAK